ncbi:MAG: short-chain fatty acid transporter [Bdellovibrionales bacterium]|nr:short-chain fatty acid transporter [Bdellovibrionales bacterium]
MTQILSALDRVLQRYTPDPFIIAVLMTFLVGLIAILATPSSPPQVIDAWGTGLWKLLVFTLQMAMILVGGYIVASSPPVGAFLQWVCSFVKTPLMAIVITTLLSAIAAWLNWGLGLVVGAFIAVEMAKRVPKVNYRLLVASSYSGFLLWHGGLSGSIPLVVATEGNFSQQWIGSVIPVEQTLFSSLNLVAVLGLMILLPLTNWLLYRSVAEEESSLKPEPAQTRERPKDEAFLDNHWWIPLLLVLTAGVYLLLLVKQGRFRLDLNSMNFIFLFLGMALHLHSRSFLKSVNEAAGKVGPLLIQYPLYAGIMGIMKDTGLATSVSELFVELASKDTLNVFVFYSAGLVNFFVPSGGGQWAVQAPVVTQAAATLGTDMSSTVMAVAWGDAWTNLAQPFWALPLLSIAGLGAKDILGFTLTHLFVSGAFLTVLFLIF